jgi:hypothetical protein
MFELQYMNVFLIDQVFDPKIVFCLAFIFYSFYWI